MFNDDEIKQMADGSPPQCEYSEAIIFLAKEVRKLRQAIKLYVAAYDLLEGSQSDD